MRKITVKAYLAFINSKKFKLNNTEVYVDDAGVYLKLHNRVIARKLTSTGYTEVSDGNYGYSRTTAERLKPFDIVLNGKGGQWFIDKTIPWNGDWVQVPCVSTWW